MRNIFYINSNLDVEAQKEVLSAFMKNKNVTGEYVFDNDIFSLKKSAAETTVYLSDMLAFGLTAEEIREKVFKSLSLNYRLFSICEGYEFSSISGGMDILKGIDIGFYLKAKCRSFLMKDILNKKRKKGCVVGRRFGSKNLTPSRCEQNKDFIISALKEGKTKNSIAKEVGVSIRTLFNFTRKMKIEAKDNSHA